MVVVEDRKGWRRELDCLVGLVGGDDSASGDVGEMTWTRLEGFLGVERGDCDCPDNRLDGVATDRLLRGVGSGVD